MPPLAALTAPADWRMVDFISDLHLHASERATFTAWQHYLRHTPADAVFILGDLFEVWVGDDVVDCVDGNSAQKAPKVPPFELECVQTMRAASARTGLFFMHGNRDFLVGPALMAQCGAQLLRDPCTLSFNAQHWLLSHGDALCLDDVPYQAFRTLVRSAAWQADFLRQPLIQRQAMAKRMRAQSEAAKQASGQFADADKAMTHQWLSQANAATLIHGHTHQPADHVLSGGRLRLVLSDWDVAAQPPRAQVLRLTHAGLARVALV